MPANRARSGFFETPHAAVYALMTATVLASGFCFIQAAGPAAPPQLLFRYGAMYSSALARHEYWRLLAYGFLHVNVLHLATNTLCLVLWGGHLKRRVGPAYFLIIYLSAMAFGAIVGNAIHTTPYLTVGASGATSGILGALLSLWILDKLDVRFDFFAVNIGLNVALAISNSLIDWGVHLGGFAAGLIACGVIDVVEKVAPYTLRCKFPRPSRSTSLCLRAQPCSRSGFASHRWRPRAYLDGWSPSRLPAGAARSSRWSISCCR